MSRGLVAALLALTAIRLAVAAVVPLSPDETYYWAWSRALAAGYYDHPPAVALLIRAGTAIAGATPLGVRLFAPFSALAGSFLLAAAGRDLLGLDGRRAGAAVLMLNGTLLLAAGSVTMTPDTPLLLLWTATLAATGRALRGGSRVALPLAGLCCGLAFDAKYTGVLLVPVIAAAVLAHRDARRTLLRRVGTWLGAGLALAATLPVLGWNAAHGWASLGKQGGRLADYSPAHALRFEAELVGGQVGLVTPLVLALAVAGLVPCAKRARGGEAGATLVLLAVLLPAAVFVLHALGGRVQANWPAVIAPAAVLCAALPTVRALSAARAAGLGFALAIPLYVQAATGLLPLPAHADVTLARLGGWRALGRTVARADPGGLPVAADDYALATELGWTCAAPVVLGVDPRWRFFRFPHPSLAGQPVLLLRSAHRRDPPPAAFFAHATPIAVLARMRGRDIAERYTLLRATLVAPARMVALLPRPLRCAGGRR